ncbi:MAG: PD-(D/E)XK nuclease family protein [Oscillospiraceae bacterium]|nr:PD-(D/E)XK nuclease family protein [Oscillospiraceae bacterium]
MLTLIIGRANAGKTLFVMDDIKRRMAAGEDNLYLIVPEQYSHDAERRLVEICGDTLPLHGEALSFSRLATRVFAEMGAAGMQELDKGGLILVLYRALEEISAELRVFGAKARKTAFLEKLLAAVREFKSLNISANALAQLAEQVGAGNPLSDKLRDFALILGAYEGIIHSRGVDPLDRLTRLAGLILDSTLGDAGCIYFDGFNDFTAQEMRVIEALLQKDAELTVCLTCDEQYNASDEEDEVFALPRETLSRLRRYADEYGVEVKTITMESRESNRVRGLVHLEKSLFGQNAERFAGVCRDIEIYAADTSYAECEVAAAVVLERVRSGLRWRDIGVMARDWGAYGPICENVFTKYGVQFFSSGREDILNKPPCALISAALEIISSRWEYTAVFKYLKTGLAGVSLLDSAEIENYVIKWNIRGAMWNREWTLPPDGENAEQSLERFNDLRRGITAPLLRLQDGIKGSTSAEEKLKTLYAFLEEIELPCRLEDKANALEKRGELRLADEYAQLWNVLKNAMEQMFRILGDSSVSASEFKKLFELTLSQYDVGVIPVSLDRTALGSMAMSRRRDLKCLIVLGATDDNQIPPGNSAFTDSERDELIQLGMDIPAGFEDRLRRELNMIYSTLTLPSEKLVVTFPALSRPAFFVKRICAVFGITPIAPRREDYMTAAELPWQELIMLSENKNPAVIANLSSAAAEGLYGREMALSPSRVDKYYACPFAHFMHSGLRLKRREPQMLNAAEAGTFIHYVLEGALREIKAGAGFNNADEALCRDIVLRLTGQYAQDELHGFEGRNERFIHLFNRMGEDASRIAVDMVGELKNSDFAPLDFELAFGQGAQKLRGIADRVDGWEHNGKLFLRVVDYKTGRKSFDLSAVLHGRDMQMLLYLFALKNSGQYSQEILPGGVLYVPARDAILKSARHATDEVLAKQRARELRRHGLILDDPMVLDAMEHGEAKQYLPMKITKDGITGDSLASTEQFSLLERHVDHMLQSARDEMLNGRIDRSPYYKNAADNACLYCEYRSVCAFGEHEADTRRYVRKMKAEEVWQTLGDDDDE